MAPSESQSAISISLHFGRQTLLVGIYPVDQNNAMGQAEWLRQQAEKVLGVPRKEKPPCQNRGR
jgi:hypothetical protein